MSSANKTTATELAVACGVLGKGIQPSTLQLIKNVETADANAVLDFLGGSDENRALLNTLWNVGNTIGRKVGRSAISDVVWTGKEKRSSTSVAAQDLKIVLTTGTDNTTEVSVKVDSRVVHNRSIEWLRVLLRGEDTDVYVRGDNWYSTYAANEQNQFFLALGGPGQTGCESAQSWYESNAGSVKKKQFAAYCAGLMKTPEVQAAYAAFVAAVSKLLTCTQN